MQLEFNLNTVDSNVKELDDINQQMKFVALSPLLYGLKSHVISIGIDEREDDKDEHKYVMFDLNKNQARYLMQFLKAFVEEVEINPEDENEV